MFRLKKEDEEEKKKGGHFKFFKTISIEIN